MLQEPQRQIHMGCGGNLCTKREKMTRQTVTRFAPSPTGYLHIGGARTALFNWLYARHTGGKMLLRIEDTDRERSTEAATAAILDGLTWLGLNWEGEAVSQFARVARHREVAEQLVERGAAYYCYCSPEELTAMRELAAKEGRPPRYDGRWRDRPASEAPAGVKPVIRIKSPLAGETVVNDVVQGEVRFPNKDLDDFILLRSDGNPTYMHAVVVDDHDMGVTHIIRGDDHLTNAARQTIIYQGMGWDVPVMAHIPLIHGADGAKLSKRHGALGVEAYREMGYLPDGLLNYLAKLGWSHGDDEIMTIAQMIDWFDIKDINKGAARFDFDKLAAVNGHHMRAAEPDALTKVLAETIPYLSNREAVAKLAYPARRSQLAAAMSGLKERAKTLVELADSAQFLIVERPLSLDEKAAALLDSEGKALLRDIHPVLSAAPEWSAPALDTAARAFAEERSLKLGKVAQPLRAALTGRSTSPGVFDVLEVLGREEALGRIADQIQ
jgi:glutamyl-tRNA synthetase